MRRRSSRGAAAVVALLSVMIGGPAASRGQSPEPAPCALADSPLTELGTRASLSDEVRPGIPQIIQEANSSYLRVRLELLSPGAGSWHLTVRDHEFRPMETLTAADFDVGARTRWTQRVAGSLLHLDLEVPAGAAGPGLWVRESIAMPEKADRPTYYTVLDPAQGRQFRSLFDPSVPTATRRLGDGVGLLLSSWDVTSWCCSGVLVAPDLFLTNWHCGGLPQFPPDGYWNDQICADTIIDLSWDGDRSSREFACQSVELKDERRDFALLRLRPLDHRGTPRPAPMRSGGPSAGAVSVVHHPSCEPKQISASCPIVDSEAPSWRGELPKVRVVHRCDTEGGSSGAPVFNAQGEVVAIHHHGRDVDPVQCRYVDDVNKGVRIDAILDFIRDKRSDLLKAMILR